MNRRLFISVTSFALLLPTALWANEIGNRALQKTHENIVGDYPSVSHISVEALAEKTDGNILLFDVREVKEFNVSRLPQSYQVDPSISPKAFMTEFKQEWSGKTIIFYCSVGRRSSILANRLQVDLKTAGAIDVYNLEGGIFAWHNQSLPLTNTNGQTDSVHPYNAFWKRGLNRKDLARYKP